MNKVSKLHKHFKSLQQVLTIRDYFRAHKSKQNKNQLWQLETRGITLEIGIKVELRIKGRIMKTEVLPDLREIRNNVHDVEESLEKET